MLRVCCFTSEAKSMPLSVLCCVKCCVAHTSMCECPFVACMCVRHAVYRVLFVLEQRSERKHVRIRFALRILCEKKWATSSHSYTHSNSLASVDSVHFSIAEDESVLRWRYETEMRTQYFGPKTRDNFLGQLLQFYGIQMLRLFILKLARIVLWRSYGHTVTDCNEFAFDLVVMTHSFSFDRFVHCFSVVFCSFRWCSISGRLVVSVVIIAHKHIAAWACV